MNILDYIILAVIFISSIVGMYNGFLVSVLGVASFFLSWIAAFAFYPVLSKKIVESTDILEKVVYYIDAASKIPSVEDRTADISTFSSDQITQLINNIQLPHPIDKILTSNILHNALENVRSLGDYFNYTIAGIIINIISFLLIFFLIRILFFIIISIAKGVTNLPVLKQFDTLLGAAFGAVRGVLFIFVIFAFVPILLTLIPIDIFSEYIEHSMLAKFFYKSNIFTNLIKGII